MKLVSNKYQKSLESALIFLKISSAILALNSIKTGRKSQSLRLYFLSTMYNLTFGALFVYAFWYIGQKSGVNDNDTNSVSQASGWLDLYSAITSQTIAILSNCINATEFQYFFHKIQVIDQKLQTVINHLNYRKVFIFATVGVLAVFLEFIITFFPDYILFVTDETNLYLLCSYFPIITTGIVKIQYATCVFLILERMYYIELVLKKLNRGVGTLVVSTVLHKNNLEIHLGTIIDKVHSTQNELCNLCTIINRLFGIQIFLMVLSAFSVCITQFYSCYRIFNKVADDKLWDIYFSMQWACLQILEIFIICYLCDSVHLKVQNMKHLIHRIMMDSKDKQLNLRLKMFSLHELHRDVKFTACGLFNMDFSTVQMLCGMITTYLIIMIQLDIAKSQGPN